MKMQQDISPDKIQQNIFLVKMQQIKIDMEDPRSEEGPNIFALKLFQPSFLG